MSSLESKKRSSLLAYLEEVGRDGKAAEFQKLLIEYRADPEARDALEKGVQSGELIYDYGSYCEEASPGWYNLEKKIKILKDFYLDRGAFANLPPVMQAAPNNNAEPSLRDIFAAIQKMEQRVSELEKRLPAKLPRKGFG